MYYCCGITSQGVMPHNEDAFLIHKTVITDGALEAKLAPPFLLGVSDGVSGEASGEVASRQCLNLISSIRFSNLDETVTTMFPLVQPALEDIADQICRTQSLENISFPEEAPYTSQLILNAVTQAVEKATVQ